MADIFKGRRATQRGTHSAPGRPVWPNLVDKRLVPEGASLIGAHTFTGQGVPDNFKFNIPAQQDIMPPIALKQADAAGVTQLTWQPLPTARGYFIAAMGGKGDDDGGAEMTLWTSSELPDSGFGLVDYQTNKSVDQWLREKVLLQPATSSCNIPKGIFPEGSGGMLRMIAYGSELGLALPAAPGQPEAGLGTGMDGERAREIRGVTPCWALAVLAAGIAAWLPGLHGPYHFDDHATPLADPASQSLAAWRHTLPQTLRPLTKLGYALEAEAGLAAEPAPRRVISLLLHALAAVLLCRLILHMEPRLGGPGAVVLALLWLLHPVHADSVLMLSGRSALLAGGLLLAALLALERARPMLAGMLFVLACLARETALAGLLPAAVIAATCPGATLRSALRQLLPLLAAAIAILCWLRGAETPRLGRARGILLPGPAVVGQPRGAGERRAGRAGTAAAAAAAVDRLRHSAGGNGPRPAVPVRFAAVRGGRSGHRVVPGQTSRARHRGGAGAVAGGAVAHAIGRAEARCAQQPAARAGPGRTAARAGHRCWRRHLIVRAKPRPAAVRPGHGPWWLRSRRRSRSWPRWPPQPRSAANSSIRSSACGRMRR